MSYRKLLVGLADPEVAPRVMDAAATLAAEHSAHLVVVHATPAGLAYEGGSSMADRVESLRGIYEARRDDDAFSSEWREIDDLSLSPIGALVELGNACDALVLGQRHGKEAGRSGWHLGEHVIGVTARPVFLVPDGGGRTFGTRRVLLAWDGGAEITRTAFDALPLLRAAESVRVHRFNPPPAERRHVSGTAEGFAEALSRQGVPVELSHGDASRLEIGEEILALADDIDADIVAVGSRTHSRVREFLFGGTTRHLLEHSARPLLVGG